VELLKIRKEWELGVVGIWKELGVVSCYDLKELGVGSCELLEFERVRSCELL